MQTFFSQALLDTQEGREADQILRACVHCGFCTATCPTYLLTGNELDSPRGRIYLIKQMLEGGEVSAITQTHLDRCLTCQSCETTCPSDVQYHRLLDIGRQEVERQVGRSMIARIKRFGMRRLFVNRRLFEFCLRLVWRVMPVLPARLRNLIPERQAPQAWPEIDSKRKMVLLNGCVQNGLSPHTNSATARVLGKLGIRALAVAEEGCCGALPYHLDAANEGLRRARHNIDLFCAALDEGAEVIVSTASGCGNFIKGYTEILAHDPQYAEKARRVATHTRDISEVLRGENLSAVKPAYSRKLAFHPPCTLQHGQKLSGIVEEILSRLDFSLARVRDTHLCCGSAGTYSLLQPEFAGRLKNEKISALEEDNPEAIATANIGCQCHLATATAKPVKHWIEYVDEALGT